MPKGTPEIKSRNVARLGAKVVLYGADFDEAKAECSRLAEAYGLAFVPPYDDPLVIAGQGTVGLEVLKQLPDSDSLDGIFAAVGGGGLVAGIAEYVKRIGNPNNKVVGVETVDGDAMARSIEKGHRVTLKEVGPFSDGTAVKIVGEETFRVCKNQLDGIVKVDNDEICAAIKDIFEGEFPTCFVLFMCQTFLLRNPISYRACGCIGPGWFEATHHRKEPRWRQQEICGGRQWRQYEF
jgi:threonine dehydratase